MEEGNTNTNTNTNTQTHKHTKHDPLVWSMGAALRAVELKLHVGSNPTHAMEFDNTL